jgi:hypothetical protein
MTDIDIKPNRKPTAQELVAARMGRPTAGVAAPSVTRPAPTVGEPFVTVAQPAAAKPATPPSTAVAIPDNRDNVTDYLDEVAPASIVGRRVKFNKDGVFFTDDDGQPVPETTEFVALCDQTLVGYVRFHGKGVPPDRIMGLLYEGFRKPPVESLPDRDRTKWETGLDGQPADPFQHHMYLVLQDTSTAELYTFVGHNDTGRRAVGTLLRHYNRMRRSHPETYPVIRLRKGGYSHRDTRVGWVNTPVFVVCGRAPSDGTVKPDTSVGTFLNDTIPF